MAFKGFIRELKSFFESFGEFMQLHHQKIVDYYVQGIEFPKDSFEKFDYLILSSERIKQNIINFRDSVNNFYFFELMEEFESCVHVLDLISNYSKWYQATLIKGRYKVSTEVDFVLKQNETLEALSTRIGFSDSETGFLDISLRNHIKETDYSTNGGTVFRSIIQNNGTNITLDTVIDELVGANVLGKDIQGKISFYNDDLVALPPKQTFEQMVNIVCSLFKGNNPEFPNEGIDKAFLSNKNGLCIMLPTVIRQLNDIISSEDTIQNLNIRSIDNTEDIMKIEFEFESILGDRIKQIVDGN